MDDVYRPFIFITIVAVIMNKKRYVVLTGCIVAASTLLSGCQLLTGYQKIEQGSTAPQWAGVVQPLAGEVNIACTGTYHCEIMQIDQTLVIDPDTHQPINSNMLAQVSQTAVMDNAKAQHTAANYAQMDKTPLQSPNAIKVVPLSASGMAGLSNYYVRMMPAKREVHVNFYPENNMGYVERFAMIHEFSQPGVYQLRAYRKKSAEANGSLLEAASPSPLCIDLLQNDRLERRFCKQRHTEHQGEFVETKVMSKSSVTRNSDTNTKTTI